MKLIDSVVSALEFHKAKDYEVAWIDAQMDFTLAKTDTSAKQEDGKSKTGGCDRQSIVLM